MDGSIWLGGRPAHYPFWCVVRVAPATSSRHQRHLPSSSHIQLAPATSNKDSPRPACASRIQLSVLAMAVAPASSKWHQRHQHHPASTSDKPPAQAALGLLQRRASSTTSLGPLGSPVGTCGPQPAPNTSNVSNIQPASATCSQQQRRRASNSDTHAHHY